MNSNRVTHGNSQANHRITVRKTRCLILAFALATPFALSSAWGQVWRYSDARGVTYYTNVFEAKGEINQASLLDAEPDAYPSAKPAVSLTMQTTSDLPTGQNLRQPQVPVANAAMPSMSTASVQNPASALGDWPPKGLIGSLPQ